ncbi:MAG: tRNA pseudouridine(55) synthase TruB [Anaerolineales bacterium]|nr:tRNA pseudouridine(55) synthase TruB [Anaerolineales bacterium]
MSQVDPFGLLIVDKPVGPTSHDVVQAVRRGLDMRKVGHTGTLDPLASGVLVICLGPATRLSEYLIDKSKRYRATILFGSTTSTYDAEGEVIHESGQTPSREHIEEELETFTGDIRQRPPDYSAVRVKGQRAYDMSRRGEAPQLEARQVTVHRLELLEYEPPQLTLEVHCSAGTYIRSLAHDLGVAVGTGAYLAGLRRTEVGPFGLDRAVALDALEDAMRASEWEQYLVPAAKALPDWPQVEVEGETLEGIRHGRTIPADGRAQGLARAIGPQGRLIAVLEPAEDGEAWHPHKVFQSE